MIGESNSIASLGSRRWIILLALVALLMSAGRAAAQFTEIDPGLPKPPFPCVVPGDYNADGAPDLLVAGLGKHDIAFTMLFENVNGAYVDSGISLLGLSRATAAWGDFDGDGHADLAMTGLTTNLVATTVVYHNQAGTLIAVPGSFDGMLDGGVAWADYDGDGDLDLLLTGITGTSPGSAVITRLYRNDGGTFTSVPHPFPNCYAGPVAFADYDNDGNPDVVIAGVTDAGALVAGLWRNDGGTFTDTKINLPGMDLGFAAWGDFDRDGDLDLLFGGNSSDGVITRLYRNDRGTFTDVHANLLGVLWASAAWGDYDRDGDPDAMIIGYDPVAQTPRSILYRNDLGTLVNSGDVFTNLYLGSVSWLDYDRDGDLDLVVAGNSAGLDHLLLERNDDICPAASWSNYGAGWPGSNGVPSLTASANPVLCSTLALDLSNSLGAPTRTVLLLGLAQTDLLTSLGGHLLVLPMSVVVLNLPGAGIGLPGAVPCDPSLCGVAISIQALELDPGASRGVSFTPGLQLVLGS
jgi:hypothetical protein